jgi:predicted nucleic-acid-binding protein
VTAIDTNVLVRFLVTDDPAQARKAKAFIDRLDHRDERAYVSDIVLCELVWVLTRSYGFERGEILPVLERLAAAKQLRFDSVDNISRALAAFGRGRGDFADYLIREHAKAAGCATVVTFDRKLAGEQMFTSP